MNKLLDYLPFESLRSGILAAVLIPGILLSLVGWIIGEHVSSLMLNLGTELIGAWFTYVLLNVLLGRFEEQEQEHRHQARRQQQLVQNLRSQVDHVARHAMEEIVLEGWHQKGFLKGANLIKANLRGLDISFASLEEVLLFEAHLEGAQFVGAKLRNAYLGSAFLNGANFQDADLENIELSHADLSGANFRGAKLNRADVTGVVCTSATILPNGKAWTSDKDWLEFTGDLEYENDASHDHQANH